VRIILDSVSPAGARLVTFEVTYWRFILPEVNTYRMWRRNSASSRARPISKTIAQVLNDLAWPVRWGRNGKGMQDHGELVGWRETAAKAVWKVASLCAVACAMLLERIGLHKQVTNRLLEPFMWHTTIITATDWANFYRQRCHPAAQPEMKALAEAMHAAALASEPVVRTEHIPYLREEDLGLPLDIRRLTSVARCARVSYLTHDGLRDINADLRLAGDLRREGHLSPFEHVALALPENETRCDGLRGWQDLRSYWDLNTKFVNGSENIVVPWETR
jgi:hypothetical protein